MVIQLNYDTAQVWNSSGESDFGVRAQLLQLCSSPAPGLMLPLQPGKQSSMETESVLCWDRGEADLYKKFPPPVPDWSVFMQMTTPNPDSLVQKALSWLDGMAVLIG